MHTRQEMDATHHYGTIEDEQGGGIAGSACDNLNDKAPGRRPCGRYEVLDADHTTDDYKRPHDGRGENGEILPNAAMNFPEQFYGRRKECEGRCEEPGGGN